MKKNSLIFALLSSMLFLAVSAYGSNDLKILRERTFTGKALYGFMNGGSDLYYEYDFAELKALDVSSGGKKFSVELYKMGSPEDAFGIYSIHAFGFHTRDTILDYCNFSKYQMQAAVGDVYVSIVYETPCLGVNMDAVEIARMFINEEVKKPDIPLEVLSNANGVTGNIKMMRGPLSVMNGAPTAAHYLDEVPGGALWKFQENINGDYLFLFIVDNEHYLKTVMSRIPEPCLVFEKKDKVLFKIN